MRLDRLLGEVEVSDLRGDPARTDVAAITHDSRAVAAGTLFCCLPGGHADGHDFAGAAVAAGATALVCQRPLPVDVTQVVVPSTRVAMAPLAAALHGHPSRHLSVAGVTGTNGKTTSTHLLGAVFEAAGRRAQVIGTLSGTGSCLASGAGGPCPASGAGGPGTTPEATELQARLARLVDEGMEAVAMEVSSHALVQHRVDATWFTVAVFTNLSQDHLDFHASMDDYFAAKASLFTPGRSGAGVINADDPWGRRLLAAATIPTRAFSLDDAGGLDVGVSGSTFRWEGHRVRLQLGGVFNVANALAAATAARELGIDPSAVAEGLSSLPSVPGRFQKVDSGQPFTIVVDYAHSPDSLEQALLAARRGAAADGGRVVVVFGCGGDRDRAKRPVMGEVASRLADVAILTSDNPRSEDPAEIITQVRAGVTRPEVLVVEPDRRKAIATALSSARAGDIVVVAGKGHEATQVWGDTVVPFDDAAVIRAELERGAGPERPPERGA
ncbi:MAG: UDP-N-acetylmuramoyl-L-alanyl-D-glutamate--2,6-diaminopimelate ligase [Acidimicrobiales bacterium]